MSIKVLLVDDHELTRKGIAYGLKTFPEINVTGDVENGEKAVEFVKQKKPDVILMDIAMPVMNGVEATKKILELYPDIKVIMLTSINDKREVTASFNSGAHGYCMKDIHSDNLMKIIKTIVDGAIWIDPKVANVVLEILQTKQLENSPNIDNANQFNLTAREKELLKLIAEGKSNKEIAEELVLSLHTVKNHVKSIIQKFSVSDRTQVAIIALKENIV